MKGRKLILFGGIVLVAAIALMVKPRYKPARLSDGTLLELSRLKFGASNAFIHASALERSLGMLLPKSGLRLGRLQLKRPQLSNSFRFEKPVLSAEFRFSGQPVDNGKSEILSPKFHRQFRLVITGDDRFPYVEEFLRTTRYQHGVFLYVNSTSFPRSSAVLHFQVQQHDDLLGPWRTIAEFHRPNPARDEERNWSPEAFPARQSANDVELRVDTVTVTPGYSNQWEYFWQTTTKIPFQVKVNGVLKTNWTLHQVNGDDASGNSLHIGASREFEDDWSIYRAFRSLDPRRVWHLWADLAPESGFAPEELFTFEIPAPPYSGFRTFGDVQLRVSWVNGNMLSVEFVGKAVGKRLIFVDAQDAQGRSINDHSGSWGRTRFWKAIKLPERSSSPEPVTIRATVAVTRNVPIQITIQPRFVESPASP